MYPFNKNANIFRFHYFNPNTYAKRNSIAYKMTNYDSLFELDAGGKRPGIEERSLVGLLIDFR
jgi:hypothetical protein